MFVNQSGKSIIDQIREKKESEESENTTGDIESLEKLSDSLGCPNELSDSKLAEEIKNSLEDKD